MGVNLSDGNIDKMGIVLVSIDLNNITANTTETQLVTVPGLLPNDVCVIVQTTAVAALTAGLFVQAGLVTAADTLQLNIANITAAPINITARTFLIAWFRPYQGVTLPAAVVA